MHYYPFNIGDYRRDTGHLSLLEHGIYRSLLDTYYLDESPLCGDDATLMRTHCIRTEEEVLAFQNVLKDFFRSVKKGYIHKGCEENISKYRAKSDKARASAKARWDANAMRTHSEGNANHKPITNNHKPITNSKEKGKNINRFTPPSVKEVEAYCKERVNQVNPINFVNFYESKGWKVGQTKMKSWKACVRTWEQRDEQKSKDSKPTGIDFERIADELEQERNGGAVSPNDNDLHSLEAGGNG